MIVSINQPAYLPWLGYFDRIRRSDLHIVLDHVTFEKGSYTNRCRIRQRDGREMWLTVPVEKGKPINETRVVDGPWREKHEKALWQNIGWFPDLAPLPTTLSEYCWRSAVRLNQFFGAMTFCKNSSFLGGAKLGVKSQLVLNICKEVGATQYLSGPQGRNYLDLPAFDQAGIEVIYHDFPTDGDWGLSAVHHLNRSFEWPDLTQQHSSQPSAAAVVDPQDPAAPRPTRAAEAAST